MKRSFLTKGLLFIGLFYLGYQPEEITVFECTGPYRYRYHYKNDCSGLNNCSKEIIPISKRTALKKGLTICCLEIQRESECSIQLIFKTKQNE